MPFTDAALGATLAVPDARRARRRSSSKPGTQPGDGAAPARPRAAGAARAGGRGDLHVVVNVLIPSSLTDEQRELLRRFAESANGDTYPAPTADEGLFDRIRHAFRG